MKTIYSTILLTLAAILFACCGYFADSNAANSGQVNAGQANANSPDGNLDANANMDLANANANIQNSVPARRPAPAKTDPLVRPAPDDSEIIAENNTDGDLVETRIFKNHDMIAKVERILTASRRDGRVRIFLKNGRVYELPVSKLKNALKDSPGDIIKAVGSDAMVAAGQPVNRPVTEGRGPGAANSAAANARANAGATPERQ